MTLHEENPYHNGNNLAQYIDSGNVDAQPTTLYESCQRSLWSLQITITLTESALLIVFAIRG